MYRVFNFSHYYLVIKRIGTEHKGHGPVPRGDCSDQLTINTNKQYLLEFSNKIVHFHK